MMTDLHMQCAVPNTGYIEYMYDPGDWNADGFQAGFAAPYPIDKSGYMHAPDAPGLGIEWDRAFFPAKRPDVRIAWHRLSSLQSRESSRLFLKRRHDCLRHDRAYAGKVHFSSQTTRECVR